MAEVLKKSLTDRVDVRVNNAGYVHMERLKNVPMTAAREQVEVNLFGLPQLVKTFLPTMRKQCGGEDHFCFAPTEVSCGSR